MKKLMIAAAAAAMIGGAYADCEPVAEDVARVYQVQFNVYTTKGVYDSDVGSTCEPGCLVRRGKDRTVLRGYVYICQDLCELKDYSAVFCDARRQALFGTVDGKEFSSTAAFDWDFCNVIGKNYNDAECAWTFTGTVGYGSKDSDRQQEYELRGAGYGKFKHSTEGFFDDLSGNFAGTASASYDLTTVSANTDCLCAPSQVLTCDSFDGLDFVDEKTVAFGTWKMKFNANVTKEYLAKGDAMWPTLLKKAFKK